MVHTFFKCSVFSALAVGFVFGFVPGEGRFLGRQVST